MKKSAFLVLVFGLIVNSCTKTEYDESKNRKDFLLEQVSRIENMSLIPTNSDDLLNTNCNNPYDIVGIITSEIAYNTLLEFKDKKTCNFLENYIHEVTDVLYVSNLIPDTLNYDEAEFIIERSLINILSKESFNTFIKKSKAIEDIVYSNDYFNDNQKMRVLEFSSVLRHNIDMIDKFFQEYESSKSGPWKDCFFSKLQELENCSNCFTERIFCIFSWPTCFGLKAIDCAIAAL